MGEERGTVNTLGFLSILRWVRALSSELSITLLACKLCGKGLSRAERHHLLQLLSICPRELPGMPGSDRGSCRAVAEMALALLRWS